MKTKKQLLVLLMGVGLTTQVTAQSVTEKWAATYDGNAGRSDKALAMVIDDNKNTYVTGKSYNGSNYDYVTVKYNSKGAEQWAATYNGTANGDDEAIAITVDDYGNVYVTGKSYNWSSTPYSCEDLTQCQLEDAAQSLGWVLSAVDAEGWVMLVDVAFEMCQDGVQDGAVCFENGNYDYATIKYNSLGVEQWVATYNGTGNANDYAKDLVVDNSGNVYVTGNSYGSGTLYDWATVKYNDNGVEQWEIRKNGYNNGNDGVSAMALDNSGNIYVTGQSDGLTLTLKYNANGVGQWGAGGYGYGGAAAPTKATALTVDDAGNVYVAGEGHLYTNGNYTIVSNFTVKYSASGSRQWRVVHNNRYSAPVAIAVDGSGNVYVTSDTEISIAYGGYSLTHVEIITTKYNVNGVEQWSTNFSDWNGSIYGDYAKDMVIDADGNVYVAGNSYNGSNFDIATVKYSTDGVEQWVIKHVGSYNQSEDAAAIAVDASGKYIYVSGSVRNSLYNDYVTIKYTSRGNGNGGHGKTGSDIGSNDTEDETLSGTDEYFKSKNNLNVYPNPNSGTFAVEYSSDDKILEIRLLNITGQLIYQENIGQFTGIYRKQIDLTAYPKGIYYLQMITDNGVENRKVVVQ